MQYISDVFSIEEETQATLRHKMGSFDLGMVNNYLATTLEITKQCL